MIEKKPFRLYTLAEEKEKVKYIVISIKLNKAEEKELNEVMKLLFTDKKSVALKNSVSIALEYLKSNTTLKILDLISNNQRRVQKNLRKDLEIKRYKLKSE